MNILEYTYSVLPMIFLRFVNANQFGSTEGFGITCDMNHGKMRLTFQSFSVPAAHGARRTWPVAPAKPWPPDPNRFRASLLISGDLVQKYCGNSLICKLSTLGSDSLKSIDCVRQKKSSCSQASRKFSEANSANWLHLSNP